MLMEHGMERQSKSHQDEEICKKLNVKNAKMSLEGIGYAVYSISISE